MKLYCTTYRDDTIEHSEFASSAGDASKIRTRLKKLAKTGLIEAIETHEVDVPTTRTDLIKFLNGAMAHASWNQT